MMKKILTVLLLAIVFTACKKDNDNDSTTPLTNPEGFWAGKVKLTGITDSVQLSLTLLPDGKATFIIFKAIPETYEGTWQFNTNSLKVDLNSSDSLFLQAGFDGPNNRFKGSIIKNNVNQGDFYLYKKAPVSIEGTYAGHYSLSLNTLPDKKYTLAVNKNGTITDNFGLTGDWRENRANGFEARLDEVAEVSIGYFYRITGIFDPATGILWGSWRDNESIEGLFLVQRQ